MCKVFYMITIYRTKYDDCLNQPQSICSCVSQIADYPAKYKNCSDLSKFFPTDFVYSTQISYTVKIYSYCVVYMLQCSVLFGISKLTESSNKWTFSFELLKFKGSVSVISDKKNVVLQRYRDEKTSLWQRFNSFILFSSSSISYI